MAVEKSTGNAIVGAALGGVVGLVLARRLGGADVRGALRQVALLSIAIGAGGGALHAYFLGQKKTNTAMLVLLVTVFGMVLVSLGILAGPDTLRTAAE